MLSITNKDTLAELESNLRSSTKTATVNGETFRIYSDQNGLRSTFALRESTGEMACLRSSGYISNELTIRKAIAECYGLPTFHREAMHQGEQEIITGFLVEPETIPQPEAAETVGGEDAVPAASEQPKQKKYREGTKQDRVFQMLKTGATIAQIMNVTGWKEPSARGILYRVFRKEMGLELASELNEYNERVYRVIL